MKIKKIKNKIETILLKESTKINLIEKNEVYLIIDSEKNIEIKIKCNEKSINKIYFIIKNAKNIIQNIKIMDNSKLNIFKINYSNNNIKYYQNYKIMDSASLMLFATTYSSNNSTEINQIQINHEANSNSNVIIRNIIESGYVETNCINEVKKNSDFCNVNQNLKSFLLNKNAKAINRPILKINNKNIVAKHGSAIGRIDKFLLYYLFSRGLNKKECIKLLCLTYFKKFTKNIKNEKLVKELEQSFLELQFITD